MTRYKITVQYSVEVEAEDRSRAVSRAKTIYLDYPFDKIISVVDLDYAKKD